MKNDTLLIAECAEYLPPELLKELAKRLDRKEVRDENSLDVDEIRMQVRRMIKQHFQRAIR